MAFDDTGAEPGLPPEAEVAADDDGRAVQVEVGVVPRWRFSQRGLLREN
jgi:hypothetical protein